MADNASLTAKTPWPHSNPLPQRFSTRYQRYLQLGGLVDVTKDAHAYAGDTPLSDVERLMFFSLAFDQIHKEGLEGDFAELGVYKGSTAAILALYARRLDRQLYLMDTFEGFDEQDFGGLDAGREVAFTDTSLATVRARVGEANTTYIKGYFPKTSEQLPDDRRYCLVHIDTDLYAPILSALEYFYPRMIPGGFLVIHDYGSLAWDGAEKAIDRFFADKPECIVHIPDSSGSAVVRRQRPPGHGSTWIEKRQFLPRGKWHSAADGNLSSILTEGWSSPEDWGTWGVGASHQITLMIDGGAATSVSVDLDVHTFIRETTEDRRINVRVNGKLAAQVTLTTAQNFRTLSLANLHSTDDKRLIIELQPQELSEIKHVAGFLKETRDLGVALHRIRIC